MTESHRSTFYRASSLYMVGMILAAVTEYGKEAAIAYRFGTTTQADTFFGAMIIPYTIFVLFTYLGRMSIVPAITGIQDRESSERLNDLLGILYSWVAILGIAILAGGVLASRYLVQLSMPGTTEEIWKRAMGLQRLLFIFTFTGAFVSLGLSIVQARKHFIVPAFMIPFSNIAVIAMIMFGGRRFGLDVLPWSYIAGMIIQLVIISATARHFRLRWFPIRRLRDPHLREISYLVAIPLISFGIRSLNGITDRTLASFLEVGSIAVINYSSKMGKGISFIFAGTLFTVSIPFLSTLFLKKELKEARTMIMNNIKILTLILVPLTAIIIACHHEIIAFLFQRGSFGVDATLKTSRAFIFFSLGLYPGALAFVLATPFFAMKKPKIPMVNSILMFLLNICLAVVLMRVMGVNGIALAYSLTFFVSVIRLYILLKMEIGRIIDRRTILMTIKLFAIALLMIAVMLTVKRLGVDDLFSANMPGKLARLLAVSLSGVGSFIVASRLVGIPEIGSATSILRNTFKPGK